MWWLQVYRRDLDLHPDNGWALRGLADALEAQRNLTEARCVARSTACLHVQACPPAFVFWRISSKSTWPGFRATKVGM